MYFGGLKAGRVRLRARNTKNNACLHTEILMNNDILHDYYCARDNVRRKKIIINVVPRR